MNTADKKVIIDAITEAAVCLAAIPDFMAGERITNALHQLQRAGAILEMEEKTEDSFFEVGARYLTERGAELEFIKFDIKGDPIFKLITNAGGYFLNEDVLIRCYKQTAFKFTKL